MLGPLTAQVARDAIEFVLPNARRLEGQSENSEWPGFYCRILDLTVPYVDDGKPPIVFFFPLTTRSMSQARAGSLAAAMHSAWKVRENVRRLVEEESRLVNRHDLMHVASVIREDFAVIVSGDNSEQNELLADWIAATIYARRLVANTHQSS